MIPCIVILSAGKWPNADFQVEKSLLLPTFPSGSSLEFFNNKLYLTGDDATQLLILDPNYNRLDSVVLFKGAHRVSKRKKVDLEASTVVTENNNAYFLLLGSASTRRREKLLLFPADLSSPKVKTISIRWFNKRVSHSGIKELNYEGLAIVKHMLVFANRGNLNNPINQFIITTNRFWDNQKIADLKIININLDKISKQFVGVSGLVYVPSKDILLFTASTEATADTYSDGSIEDSYIGWIKNISTKLHVKEISADGLINLSKKDRLFKKQKIESVCVEKVEGNDMTLHLVADNDNGETKLFKLKISL